MGHNDKLISSKYKNGAINNKIFQFFSLLMNECTIEPFIFTLIRGLHNARM